MSVTDFPSEDLDKLCNEVLTTIESSELKLLNWGFVELQSALDSTLPILMEKLSDHGKQLWESAQQFDITLEDIIVNLKRRRLIFNTTAQGQNLYRSRFAETIRLLSLLRQRFSFEDWQTASRLVSDVKISVDRRRYPKRNISKDELVEDLRQMGAAPLYIGAVEHLLRDEQNGSYLSLARFQKDAIFQQYYALHPQKGMLTNSDRAVVIGAGTGSGKTKAFYIPAMAEISATLTATHYVRALAIYPRIELLKDQFLEAFLEARKLNEFLVKHKPRIITIGAYYGDTPVSAGTLLTYESKSWRKADPQKVGVEGWESPYFSCPECKPQSRPLIWYKEDVEKESQDNSGKHARLRCPNCYFETEPKQLLLTREQMKQNPPDILFTTTEMLNKRLSNAKEHHLFGIDTTNTPPPRMLLLDEIHTYEGLGGTQIAYLLRRWRHARRQQQYVNLCCVGLSATLNNAESFFSRLTGISSNLVNYVHPQDEDMEEEGIEYNVVLKGDPVSGTSLLSTSVQVVMLMGRILDKSSTEPSNGAYGQKVFAFTDKLDVINRWFHIEKDVESPKKLLSQYRKDLPEDTEDIRLKKRQAGQTWQICELVDHPLNTPLMIDVTSSQNRGVNAHANVVIATSTLEVGFNDATVGAVIQHKAPRSLASFLQRKGRAGRTRRMRPWMVVVTSAYGRDRWAFQHAESLFSPTLSDIALPLDNYYVRKMQATYAIMDWLSLKMKREQGASTVDVWDLLSSDDKGKSDFLQNQRRTALTFIEEVLNGTLYTNLSLYLQQALDIHGQREIDSILWDEPRSIMFEVLPTLLRQLESSWQRLNDKKAETWADNITNYPMPDFVTPNLFSDLKSPDITLHLPPDLPRNDKYGRQIRPSIPREDETLSLQQCLTEYAPGNVSKRYAKARDISDAHWLAIPDDSKLKHDKLPISSLTIDCDNVPKPFMINGKVYQLYRPRAYTLQRIPQNVKETSVAHMFWNSHFREKKLVGTSHDEDSVSDAPQVLLPKRSKWNKFFTEIRSHTHEKGSWVEIARLATRVQIDTRFQGKKEAKRLWLEFEENEQPAGLGFINYVDALEFRFQPIDITQLVSSPAWTDLYKNLGAEFFRYKLQRDQRFLEAKLSVFEIDWLWQLELSMLVATSVAQQCSFEDAALLVHKQRIQLAEHTMKVIFQSQQVDDYEEEKVGRLHDKLRLLLTNATFQQALESCEKVLWDWNDEQLQEWMQQCYASSLGATLFAALTQLTPDIDPDDLVLDIDGESIWISELTPGGIGIISKITDSLVSKPYEFELQMLDTLQYCERQQLATQLRMIADMMRQEDQELLRTFTSIRNNTDLPKQETTLEQLKDVLEEHGVSATRELVVALHAKFLRPNSASDTDKLLATLVSFWQSEEQRLECAIDLRIIAVAALKISAIEQQVRAVLERINGSANVENSQIFNLLQSLLWLPCTDSCPDCIEKLHQYQDFVKPSRALLLSLMEPYAEQITYGDVNWKEQLKQELESKFVVLISCLQDDLEVCKRHLLDVLTEPVEVGFQFFYPVVERISRTGRLWTIEMRIREFAHV